MECLDDGWMIVSCTHCGRTIRHRKNDVSEVPCGPQGTTRILVCPGCAKENYDPVSVKELTIPPEIQEAVERVSMYRAGRTAAEIYGKCGREGYRDDTEEIAEYFIRSLGVSV